MAVEGYNRLTTGATDQRRVFKVDRTPEDLLGPMMTGLDRLILETDRDGRP